MNEIRAHATEAMRQKLIGNEQLKLGHHAAARDTYIEGLRSVFGAVENLKSTIQASEEELRDNMQLAREFDLVKVEIEEIRVQLISNLSLAEVKMELWAEALSHSNMVLVAEPLNMKALFRRSIARIRLKEQLEDALADLQKLAQRDCKNADIVSAMSECKEALKKERKTDNEFRSSLRGSLKKEQASPTYVVVSKWLGDWFGHLSSCGGVRNLTKK